MGAPQKTPHPPKISLPGPTTDEQALMGQQKNIIQQMQQQQQTGYGQANQAYGQANSALSNLDSQSATNPYNAVLSPDQTAGINQQYQDQLKMGTDNINMGANKTLYDTNQQDSIASLAARGVLDSRTGSNALGYLGAQHLADLNNVSNQALTQRDTNLNALRSSLSNADQARAQYGASLATGLNQTANTAGNDASTSNNTLNDRYTNERYSQQAVNAQNAQSDYMWRLSNFKPKKTIGQRAIGATIGAATGYLTGGPVGAVAGGVGGAM